MRAVRSRNLALNKLARAIIDRPFESLGRRAAPISASCSPRCGRRAALLLLMLLAASPAWGQRVQFPTMISEDASASSGLAPVVAQAPAPLYPAGPTAPSTFGGGPPGAATWDQYADPAASAGAPYSPYAPSPYAPAPNQPAYPEGLAPPPAQDGMFASLQKPLRLLQEVRGRYTWLHGGTGAQAFGVTDVETSATFAVPPLLITPGYAMHFWEGPKTTAANGGADLPPRVYDAYLDLGWHPQVTDWFSVNLGARVGVYTDFNTFSAHSIRTMGRALGVVTYTPELQFAAGVVYLDRNRIKLLPAGGVIWTPNADARYEFLFPNPRLARRYTTIGTTDLWYYLAGEYGGGAWTIKRANGMNDAVDYNDIRVSLGLEAIALSGLRGTFEVGYVFDRQIIYRSVMPDRFDPSSTILLRASLSY